MCRVRKTRCNAKRPSCSFCEDLKIECVYSRPQPTERSPRRRRNAQPAQSSPSTEAVLDRRLGSIEAGLNSLLNRSRITSIKLPGIFPSRTNSLSCWGYWPNVQVMDSSQQTLYSFKVPSLLVFETASPCYRRWAYNHLQDFYDDQLTSVSNMSSCLRMPTTQPNFSRTHVLGLQEAFLTNVLRLFPFIEHEALLMHTNTAASTGYEAVNSSVCLALLVCAIGSCAQSPSLYEVDSGRLPGFPYFARAMNILEGLSAPVTDIPVLQCQVLVA